MKVLFISLASNRNKAIQKQKDTLLNNLKQLESRHKLNSISDLEQKIKQCGNQLHLLDINRKLNFTKHTLRKAINHINCQHKEQDKITIISVYEILFLQKKKGSSNLITIILENIYDLF